MIKRHLSDIAFSSGFGRQMRFIIGPRQSGKTTIAKEFLETVKCEPLYYNWDNRKIRDAYINDNHFFSSDIYNINIKSNKPWLCMDEIHKMPEWKNILKDFFDSFEDQVQFIITGSAKLNMLRKHGDSLAGRYFSFHLYPLRLEEVTGTNFLLPPNTAEEWILSKLANVKYEQSALSNLLQFSGFPEPFSHSNTRFHNKWQRNYIDRIIQEDIRDLTRIIALENIFVLMKLLPERVGAPLSVNSLARDIQTTFSTISRYIKALELAYLVFQISPYSSKIARSIVKEKKLYFYDWTWINDPGKLFENYVAMELKTMTELWSDAGENIYDLSYIRTRDGKETDFLILKDSLPWLLIEVKLKHCNIDYHHKKNRNVLGEKLTFLQIVREPDVTEKRSPYSYQISASRVF